MIGKYRLLCEAKRANISLLAKLTAAGFYSSSAYLRIDKHILLLQEICPKRKTILSQKKHVKVSEFKKCKGGGEVMGYSLIN